MELHRVRPSTYFFIGQITSLFPYLFLNSRVFLIYNVKISFLLIYITLFAATLFYFVNLFMSKIRIRKVLNFKNIRVGSPNTIIFTLLIISIVAQLLVYGGSPLISLISDPSEIRNINSKNSSIPGLLGLVLLCNQLIVLIFILALQKKANLLLVLGSLFSTTMAAKRQMLIVLIIALSSRKKMRLRNIIFALFSIVFLFSFIGLFRGSRNLFEPILFYLSYSTINFSQAILSLNDYMAGYSGVLSIVDISLPTIFRGEQELNRMYDMAEVTAGFSLAGATFLKSGIIGLTIMIFFIALFTSYLWRQAQNNHFFRVMYIFSIWPLIASNTYNHFTNVSFYLLPLVIFFILVSILPKRPHKI